MNNIAIIILTYVLKCLGRILQLRVAYYVRPNTLEYLAEYSKQSKINFGFYRVKGGEGISICLRMVI